MKKDKLKRYPLNYNGSIWFAREAAFEEMETNHVTFRSEKEIVVEFKGKDTDGFLWAYTLTLTQKDGPYYSGEWEAQANDGDRDVGKADCIIYRNEKGFLLCGRWVEEEYDYRWFVELNFEDQE